MKNNSTKQWLQERDTVYECCRALEAALSEHSPDMVADVRLFVRELQRLNLMEER